MVIKVDLPTIAHHRDDLPGSIIQRAFEVVLVVVREPSDDDLYLEQSCVR